MPGSAYGTCTRSVCSPHTVKTDIRVRLVHSLRTFKLPILFIFTLFHLLPICSFLLCLSHVSTSTFILLWSTRRGTSPVCECACVSVFWISFVIHSHFPPKLQQHWRDGPFELHEREEREREEERREIGEKRDEERERRNKWERNPRRKEREGETERNERAIALHECICVCFHISLRVRGNVQGCIWSMLPPKTKKLLKVVVKDLLLMCHYLLFNSLLSVQNCMILFFLWRRKYSCHYCSQLKP